MRIPATLRWIGLALLGILVAAAVAIAASRLASREIGLASEPISAGRELAPAVPRQPRQGSRAPSPDTTTTTPSTPAPVTPPQSGTEDHSSRDSDGDGDDD